MSEIVSGENSSSWTNAIKSDPNTHPVFNTISNIERPPSLCSHHNDGGQNECFHLAIMSVICEQASKREAYINNTMPNIYCANTSNQDLDNMFALCIAAPLGRCFNYSHQIALSLIFFTHVCDARKTAHYCSGLPGTNVRNHREYIANAKAAKPMWSADLVLWRPRQP